MKLIEDTQKLVLAGRSFFNVGTTNRKLPTSPRLTRLALRLGVSVVACHWLFGFVTVLVRSSVGEAGFEVGLFAVLFAFLCWAAWDVSKKRPQQSGLRACMAATMMIFVLNPWLTGSGFDGGQDNSFFVLSSGIAYALMAVMSLRIALWALIAWSVCYCGQRLLMWSPFEALADTALTSMVALAVMLAVAAVSDVLSHLEQSKQGALVAQQACARHTHAASMRSRAAAMLRDTILNALLLAGRDDDAAIAARQRLAADAQRDAYEPLAESIVDPVTEWRRYAERHSMAVEFAVVGSITGADLAAALSASGRAELNRIRNSHPAGTVHVVGVLGEDNVAVSFEWTADVGDASPEMRAESLTSDVVDEAVFERLGGRVQREALKGARQSTRMIWQPDAAADRAATLAWPRQRLVVLTGLMGLVVAFAFVAGAPIWAVTSPSMAAALGLGVVGVFAISVAGEPSKVWLTCVLGVATLAVSGVGAWLIPQDRIGAPVRYWYLVALVPSMGLLGFRWLKWTGLAIAGGAVVVSGITCGAAGTFDVAAWLPVGPMLGVSATCGWLLRRTVDRATGQIVESERKQVLLWREAARRDDQAQMSQELASEVSGLTGPSLRRVSKGRMLDGEHQEPRLTGLAVVDHSVLSGVVDKGMAVAIRAARTRGVDVDLWGLDEHSSVGQFPRGCFLAVLGEARPGSSISIAYGAVGVGVWSVCYVGTRTDVVSAAMCSLRAQAGLSPKPVMRADEGAVMLTWSQSFEHVSAADEAALSTSAGGQ